MCCPVGARLPTFDFFEVLLQRSDHESSEAFGLKVLCCDGLLIMYAEQDNGILQRWNCDHPTKKIREGYAISSVNGKEDSQAMLAEFQSATRIRSRASRFAGWPKTAVGPKAVGSENIRFR
ncbi:unnamed protein product [Durusdinium trenchii]|uniref:Uncharacterized protein n=1 Tax=Durusdinium trenchii TaxID=1381693 RepID=A0ABP0Q583_9DINO